MPIQDLITSLESLPREIELAAEERDLAAVAYNAERVRLTAQALGAAMFTDKSGQPRPAANDTERKLAVESRISEALENKRTKLSRLALKKKRADRNLERARNQFLAAQLIAKLTLAEQRDKRA